MVASKWTGPVAFEQSVLLLKHCLSLGPAQHTLAQPCPLSTAIRLTPKADVSSDLHCKLPVKRAVWQRSQHSSNNGIPAAFMLRSLMDGSGVDSLTVGAKKQRLMEPPYICITAPSMSILNLNLEQLVKQKVRREPCVTTFEKQFGTLDHTVASLPLQCKTLESTKIAVPVPSYQFVPIPIPVCHSLIHTNTTVLRHTDTETARVQWVNKTHSVSKMDSKRHFGSPQLLDRATPAQLSIALLKLREEIPAFFSGHHSLDMYAHDMRFENNLGNFAWELRGCPSYHLFLTSSRLAVHCWYRHPKLDLLKITKQTEAARIEARWRVRGEPRVGRRRQRVVLEGFSTFVVNSDGQISLHKMDKVMPAPKEKSRVRTWIAQLGVILGLTPRPSLKPQPVVDFAEK